MASRATADLPYKPEDRPLRILSVHNYYLERGGEDQSLHTENGLLRRHGHAVDEVTENNERVAELGVWRTAVRTVWSQPTYNAVRARLRREHYDCVHVNNFFPLISPSVYYAAKAEGVPVVQNIRNYRLACLNGYFLRDGRPCEDCLGRTPPWPGIIHRCYRGSLAGSSVVATMLTAHRLRGTWLRQVDAFVALTEFARGKLAAAGLPADRIVVKPNFLYPDPGVGRHGADYALFVGRLSPEKGISTLLAAWEHLPHVPLRILGSGPLGVAVAEVRDRLPHITWADWVPPAEVIRLMQSARLLVFPTLWYEGFPRVVLEAFAVGLPVVATRSPNLAQIIEHGRSGLLVRGGDAGDLAAQIASVWEAPGILQGLGAAARSEFEAKYTAEQNYRMLMSLYRRVLRPAAR